MQWGAKYGIGVLIDMHAAPGSQNGQANSAPAVAVCLLQLGRRTTKSDSSATRRINSYCAVLCVLNIRQSLSGPHLGAYHPLCWQHIAPASTMPNQLY
jgi:hypothetical protein